MDIKHQDARLLREALAHVINYGSPALRNRAISALQEYGRRVEGYCDHPEVVSFNEQRACLDCGQRFITRKVEKVLEGD